MSNLVDSHCHIPLLDASLSVEEMLLNAEENDIEHMLCVAIDLEGSPAIIDLAREYEQISASVGVHPNTEMESEPTVSDIVSLACKEQVVAIGETGLDYFRSKGDTDWQRERFRTHIRTARELGKPLIIHMRDAKEDVIRILKEEKAEDVGGVMHCFVEDWETAQKTMDMNFMISFSGIVTFKNAKEIQQVARQVPLERMLVETDSPYLAPVPLRGKLNQPAYVRYVAEHIAELKDETFSTVATQTTENYYNLFKSSN